jgi:hypothetical protein
MGRKGTGMSVQEVDGAAVEAGFQDVLSATARDGGTFSREPMRRGLSVLIALQPEVSFSASGCYVSLPGLPISGEGADLDGALDDLVTDLRDYSLAWHTRLKVAPNHRENWGLVMLTDLSTDEELHNWLASL